MAHDLSLHPPCERKLTALHTNDRLHYLARDLRFLPHSLAWRVLLAGRMIPRIIVHSRWVGDIVRAYGFPSASTREIPLGCAALGSASDVQPGATRTVDRPKLVTVGGIAHTKGQHDAVRAIGVLRSEFPDLTYQIIGEVRDASYLSHLGSLIDGAGLSARISIRTDVGDDAKRHALRAADLYLQPSHEEGFCLAYIEAASQVPRLVGTETGAMRRISQGDPAMQVVPPGSPPALASAIRSLLQQPLATDLMRSRVDRLEREFSWRRYLDDHESLYDEVVETSVEPQLSTV